MKEIQFRVWDNVNYMSQPFTLLDIQSKQIQFTSDCKIMQYTGLKDFTNNMGIAEEDICKAKFKRKTIDGFEVIDVSGRIFYDDWEFMYCLITEEGEIYSCNRLHKYEVIGNVYENPELIKDNMIIEK